MNTALRNIEGSGVHATRAYRRFLVFPSTFILYYNSIRHENAVRDQQTRLSMCSRSVGRARFSSRFAFPERPQLRRTCRLALIKNERHFFSYYVNGLYPE